MRCQLESVIATVSLGILIAACSGGAGSRGVKATAPSAPVGAKPEPIDSNLSLLATEKRLGKPVEIYISDITRKREVLQMLDGLPMEEYSRRAFDRLEIYDACALDSEKIACAQDSKRNRSNRLLAAQDDYKVVMSISIAQISDRVFWQMAFDRLSDESSVDNSYARKALKRLRGLESDIRAALPNLESVSCQWKTVNGSVADGAEYCVELAESVLNDRPSCLASSEIKEVILGFAPEQGNSIIGEKVFINTPNRAVCSK